MKNLFGVMVITSAIALGAGAYLLITANPASKNTETANKEVPVGQADISQLTTDLWGQTEKQLNGVSNNTANEANKQKKNKPAPELESFKGLEEESNDLLKNLNDLPNPESNDPLKDALR